ncbi:thiamine-phosphate kinase [Chondromyces apiculatus]|uniref:Thiamine-monophosphate kinase n=1 Tax=Chondromyces apiculatus DSM 436 TaxID=1192034 RepID=A0A017SYH1_9BACT|nr:thiamine-phosphate kinase [Chondromyces apiculatus]EYF01351.1 Thiamine-monophosphate kinase [Chondromyces apiculatus DSM 436]
MSDGPPERDTSAPRTSSEFARIDVIRRLLTEGSPLAAQVLLGIGDDAAALAPVDEPLVWTVDCAVDGVHFRHDLMSFEDAGYRATMAAASDLAAMGARPLGLLASLILPRGLSDADLEALVRGQRAACDTIGAPLIGGNLARGRELSITTTALGATPRPLRRDGARPGDELALAGPVGLAAAGLRLAQQGGPVHAEALAAFRRPLARIEAGLSAREGAHAGIDISDGLASDLGHLIRASGIRAELDAAALLTDSLREAATLVGADPLDLALHGGEDYALLVAGPSVGALPGFTRIGRCMAGTPGTPEILLASADGRATAVTGRGFDHFT